MRLAKIDKIQIPPINALEPEYKTRKTPVGMPELNFLAVMFGSMGQGKTVALIKMLKMYDKTKSYDRIIWWSPTFHREPKGKAFMKDKHNFELVHYDSFSNADFIEETTKMNADIENYREYLRQLKVWEKFVDNNYDVDRMEYDEVLLLNDMGMEKPTTTFKWGFPSFAIVFDDMILEKAIFSANCKNEVSKFFVVHRHSSCCVFVTSQIYSNGLPRQIRGVISVWMLFRCKSKELQEEIAKELSFKVDKDTLMKAWDFATAESPHSFLFIDYKQNDINKMFRRDFDQQIILD